MDARIPILTLVEVESAPTAMFNYQDNIGVVDFSNSSSNANSFEWDFGDNTGSTESDPSHTVRSKWNV